jgi:ubiquinone/menaquinone biosynthesis C-methylase UbiE
VPYERDVGAFHDRAPTYEQGWRGRMHADICARTLERALSVGRAPRRVLDVGCGTGLLLRGLADRLPDDGQEFVGVDAADGMVEAATARADDGRLRFSRAVAEDLPFPDEHFDLVVSTTSFDHWTDQASGLEECARVLTGAGHLVLTDIFSLFLVPTLLFGRRRHARTRRRASVLLDAAGFRTQSWERAYQLIIATVVAAK